MPELFILRAPKFRFPPIFQISNKKRGRPSTPAILNAVNSLAGCSKFGPRQTTQVLVQVSVSRNQSFSSKGGKGPTEKVRFRRKAKYTNRIICFIVILFWPHVRARTVTLKGFFTGQKKMPRHRPSSRPLTDDSTTP